MRDGIAVRWQVEHPLKRRTAEIERRRGKRTIGDVLIRILGLRWPRIVAHDVGGISTQQALSVRCFSRSLLPQEAIRRQGLAIHLVSATRSDKYSLLLHGVVKARLAHVPREHTGFGLLLLHGKLGQTMEPERRERRRMESGSIERGQRMRHLMDRRVVSTVLHRHRAFLDGG